MQETKISPTPQLSRGRRWGALAVLTASLFVIAMDMTILNIAIPDMAAEIRPTSGQQLWIIDIYSLVLAGLLVPAAAIADRLGRRRMLLIGYLIFAVSSALVLFAETAPVVIGIRALLGVGGALIMPTTLSLIRVIFTDPKERATALSIWAATAGLGSVVGPLVGGFLLEHFNWHAAFLVNIPLMVLGMIFGYLLLIESAVENPGKWDATAAVLSLVGMVALVWSLKQFGKKAEFNLPWAWVALALAAITLVLFARRCLRSDSPLLDFRLFKSRQFSAGIIAAFTSTMSMIAALLLVAQWLQLVKGSSPIETGIELMPIAVTGAIVSLLSPWLSQKIGARSVLAGGLACSGIGLLYIGAVGDHLSRMNMMIALALLGAGMGALAIGSALIMGGVPEHRAGNAGALEESSYELGATFGVTILGSISALVYRSELAGSAAFSALEKTQDQLADSATESLGVAMSIANDGDLSDLAHEASEAFTHSLQVAGLSGGVLVIIAAVIVFFLTPKSASATHNEH